jgi:predicted nucleotidyltransferase
VAGRPSLLSDLDVAFVLVAGAKRDDPLFAERLASGLAVALDSAVEIDANVVDDLPLPVLGRVVTEGILLYESDPVRRVEFETSTRRLYFDFLPFLERDAREGLKARG